MTKRLNDNEDCLWRRVQNLEQEIARLKQIAVTVQHRPPDPETLQKVITRAGVELSIHNISLAQDKKTVTATVYIKNNNIDPIQAMLLTGESSFIIPNMLTNSPINAQGIAICLMNPPIARNCLQAKNAFDYTNLSTGEANSVYLSFQTVEKITATKVDIKLRIILKKYTEEGLVYDFPFNGIMMK